MFVIKINYPNLLSFILSTIITYTKLAAILVTNKEEIENPF